MDPFGYYLVEVRCYGHAYYLVADHHQPKAAALRTAVSMAGDNNEEDGQPGPVEAAEIITYVPISHVAT